MRVGTRGGLTATLGITPRQAIHLGYFFFFLRQSSTGTQGQLSLLGWDLPVANFLEFGIPNHVFLLKPVQQAL